MAELEGMVEHRDDRLEGLPIYYVSTEHPEPDSMVVLMPGAQSSKRIDRRRRGYSRWSWHTAWPSSLVLAFADPVLQLAEELDGAWFVHRDHDVLASIAAIVSELATARSVPADPIVFYGSSLGGFGSLACAAHLPGARAVVEVPQIDFALWHKKAVAAVEEHVIGGAVSGLREVHPERVYVPARFEFAGLVPPLTILSNSGDRHIVDQTRFIEWCEHTDLPRLGEQCLVLSETVSGHTVLSRADALPYVAP